jgi:hypothetical protein
VDNTIGVVIVLMAISASVLTAIAFAPMAVHWEVIAYVVAGIILVVGWVGGIVAMTES